MLRKTLVALAGAAMLCTAFVSTEASARYGGWYGSDILMGFHTVTGSLLTGFGTVTMGILTCLAKYTTIPERTLTQGGSPTQDVTP